MASEIHHRGSGVVITSQDIQRKLEENSKLLDEWDKLIALSEKAENPEIISKDQIERHIYLKKKLKENLAVMAKIVQTQIKSVSTTATSQDQGGGTQNAIANQVFSMGIDSISAKSSAPKGRENPPSQSSINYAAAQSSSHNAYLNTNTPSSSTNQIIANNINKNIPFQNPSIHPQTINPNMNFQMQQQQQSQKHMQKVNPSQANATMSNPNNSAYSLQNYVASSNNNINPNPQQMVPGGYSSLSQMNAQANPSHLPYNGNNVQQSQQNQHLPVWQSQAHSFTQGQDINPFKSAGTGNPITSQSGGNAYMYTQQQQLGQPGQPASQNFGVYPRPANNPTGGKPFN